MHNVHHLGFVAAQQWILSSLPQSSETMSNLSHIYCGISLAMTSCSAWCAKSEASALMNAICHPHQATRPTMLYLNESAQQTWPCLVTGLQQHLGNASHSCDIIKATCGLKLPMLICSQLLRNGLCRFWQALHHAATLQKSMSLWCCNQPLVGMQVRNLIS